MPGADVQGVLGVEGKVTWLPEARRGGALADVFAYPIRCRTVGWQTHRALIGSGQEGLAVRRCNHKVVLEQRGRTCPATSRGAEPTNG